MVRYVLLALLVRSRLVTALTFAVTATRVSTRRALPLAARVASLLTLVSVRRAVLSARQTLARRQIRNQYRSAPLLVQRVSTGL